MGAIIEQLGALGVVLTLDETEVSKVVAKLLRSTF